MLLGTAGVGKTSFTRSLMRLEYIRNVDSTIISNISTVQVQPVEYESLENSLRPVGYKRHTFSQEKWELVTKNDEIDELAVLLAAVYDDDESQCLLNTVAALSLYHIDSPLPVPELSTEEIHHQKEYVNVILSEAIGRAKQMSPMQLKDIKPQPFLHFWDCGGQSVFLEILPAFLTARTMFFLLFDASKSFEEKWKGIRTFSGTSVCDETGNTTTKDLLFNWMANIHHHLAQLDEREAFRDYPRIYCIGTHGDMVENEKQAEVVKGIKDQYKGKAFAHLIKDTLIVDNTTAGSENEDNNFQLIRSEVNNFTLEKLIVKTPVSWILFRKVIQMLDTKVISLKEAHAIGLACKIPHSDVPKVLLFYHDLGALLYYPYINGLQNKVFINPKWFVDTVGKIFTLEGREEKDTAAMWLLLREKGILVKPLYSAVWKDCPEIEPDDMMELLVHFRLAAEVKTEEFYIQEVKQFFLPAVLKSFDGTPRFDDGGSYHATFLHITFSTNFVPPGFFTRFITSLAKSRLCELSFENGVFRNHVTFKFGEPCVDDVTLTDLNDAIQVSLVRYSDSSNMKPFDEICRQLLHVLANCGNEVDIALSSSRNDCSIKIARKFCYICASLDCKEYEPHYLLPAASGQTSDLPLYCQKRKVRRRPTREEAFWFVKEQVTENATSRRIDHTEMFTISDAIGDKADDLAANLNMLDKLRVIQQNQSFRSNPVLQLLFDWDRGGGNREDLIAALKRTKLHHLADQVASANYMRRKSRPESASSQGTFEHAETNKELFKALVTEVIKIIKKGDFNRMQEESKKMEPDQDAEVKNLSPVQEMPEQRPDHEVSRNPSPVQEIPISPPASATTVPDNDLLRCSSHLRIGDINKLLEALDDDSNYLHETVRKYSDVQMKAYWVLKKWLDVHPDTSHEMLKNKLELLGFSKAANNLSANTWKCSIM